MTKAISRAVVIALAIVAACASAGGNNGSSDAPLTPPSDAAIHHDSTILPHDAIPALDAPPPIDGAVPHDAPLPQIDAAVGGQLCTDNTQCPDSGTCCYFFVCEPGLGAGSNLCFPN